jgi:hypothetical protein
MGNVENNDKDRMDQWLDAALRQHGEAEPRTGLESRVLAFLSAQEEGLATRRNWWPERVAAVTIVAVGAMIFFVLGHDSARQRTAAKHEAPVATKVSETPSTQPTAVLASMAQRPRKSARTSRSSRVVETAASAEPRLEQFPTRRPLSAQEKMLESYVAQFHKEAVLVARVQAGIIKQDLLEFEKQHEPRDVPQDTPQ